MSEKDICPNCGKQDRDCYCTPCEHSLGMERQRVAELESSLAAVIALHDYSYIDKGIGVSTPEGIVLIKARELLK